MQPYEDAPMYEYADKQVSVESSIDFLNVSNTLVVNRMNDLFQGVKPYQRIGNTVTMKRFRIRGMFYNASIADYLRLLVIYSTSAVTVGTGAATDITIDDILKTQQADGSFQTTVWSPPNLANADRFEILADLSYRPGPTSVGGQNFVLDPNSPTIVDHVIEMDHQATYAPGQSRPISGALFMIGITQDFLDWRMLGTYTLDYEDE